MFRGSICALITPFSGGAVDEPAFEAMVERHIKEGTHGLVPCGTTGESVTLSHEEHDRVIEICVKTASGRVPVIAGTGSNSTAEAIRLTRNAEQVGADAALVVAPYYNKPSQEGMFAHFKEIHDNSGIPIFIYNVPPRTMVDVSVETMARLAELPRVIGVKDATADMSRVSDHRALIGKEFIQLSGEDGSTLGYMAHGGVGCISVTANVAPALCSQFQNACLEGDFDRAVDLQDQLMPLHHALFAEPNPMPAKYAASRLGLCQPDGRLPMIPISKTTQDRVDRAMEHAGLI